MKRAAIPLVAACLMATPVSAHVPDQCETMIGLVAMELESAEYWQDRTLRAIHEISRTPGQSLDDLQYYGELLEVYLTHVHAALRNYGELSHCITGECNDWRECAALVE